LSGDNYAGGRYTLVGGGNPFSRETPKVRRNRFAEAVGYERTFISTWDARASKPCRFTIEETAAADVHERQPRGHVPLAEGPDHRQVFQPALGLFKANQWLPRPGCGSSLLHSRGPAPVTSPPIAIDSCRPPTRAWLWP